MDALLYHHHVSCYVEIIEVQGQCRVDITDRVRRNVKNVPLACCSIIHDSGILIPAFTISDPLWTLSKNCCDSLFRSEVSTAATKVCWIFTSTSGRQNLSTSIFHSPTISSGKDSTVTNRRIGSLETTQKLSISSERSSRGTSATAP